MTSSALARGREGVRGLFVACALGLAAAVVHAFAAVALARPLESAAGAAARGELARACAGLAALSVLQALAVFAVCRAARLLLELPRAVGAGAGLFAAALPAVVLALGEGSSSLLPWALLAVRLGGALLCAGAGAAALRKSRARPTSTAS